MSLAQILKILTDAGIEENEAKKEISILLEHFCNYTEKDRIFGKQLSDEQLRIIEEKALIRAEKRIPVQYITGEAWFMGNFFKVTPDVLIPRDETEILVRECIRIIRENDYKDVLDIGTGTGCIACTIAKNTTATVLGVDISSDALRVALDNVTKLNINNKAIFRKSDLFSKIRDEEIFDIIISNPPYIPIGIDLEPEVRHEPKTALFAEENGLKIYRNIIEQAPKHLKRDGYIAFELGYGEAEKVHELLNKDFKNINLIEDMSGIKRVITAVLK